MDTFTIREAAEACGMTYEAMRARVDRGTLSAGRRRKDGARISPRASWSVRVSFPALRPPSYNRSSIDSAES